MTIARLVAPLNRLRRFRDDHGGGVAAAFAISLTVMIGFGGAATEIGTWLLTRRAMQGAADVAAVSAVNATAQGGPDITTQARGVAAQNGWTHGANGITVTVNQPPTVGNFTGNAQAVEVIIAQAQPLFFSGILPGVAAPTIRARGVATPPSANPNCITALGTGSAVQANGNGIITLNGCNVASNGNIAFSGTHSSISARSIDIGGTVSAPSQLTLTNGPGTQSDPKTVSDPFAGRSFTKPTGTAGNCHTYVNGTTPSPGVAYCGGMNITSSVSFPTGIYYIEGGGVTCAGFCVSGGAGVNVTSQSPGVTIVLTNSSAAPSVFATVSITGQAHVNLTDRNVPGGTTNGVVFFGDRAQPAGATETFAGNGTDTLTGAIYFPNETVSIAGNGVSSNTCLVIVAKTIIATGNGSLTNSNCIAAGAGGSSSTVTRLVE
jgi:Flp pilus assembly protein TadG